MNKLSGLTLLLALAGAAAAAETPEQILQRAEQLEKEGKISRAVEVYRSFLKAHPKHSQTLDAHYRLAKCLDALGYVDEVFQQLQTVINSPNKRYRNRAEAFYMLGRLRASLKQYDEAAKVFERMLAEGAGLYEDEVLSLCAGYYAVQNKYDDAAAKFNLLKRRKDSRYAEQAAYKLAVLWLRAERLDLAVEAVEDLAQRFPANPQARGLMFQVANLFRKKRQFARAIAACEQLKARFPKSREAQAVGYVIGLCHRDGKQFAKAVAAFDSLTRSLENRKNGIAAEGVLQSADILYGELGEQERAMGRYEEAAKLAKDSQGERRQQVLEQCYFRLAEHHFSRKKWSVALECYSLLRRVGTDINILPRILKCQAQLEMDLASAIDSDADVAYVRQKIKENAGTFAAAEGEVFLLDRQLHEALRRKRPAQSLVPKYQEILKKYPRSVLSQQSLESYIYAQLGVCWTHGGTKEQLAQAIAMYEKGLAVDPKTPYAMEILEGVASVADAIGDNDKSFATYKRLFELAAGKVEKGTADDADREGLCEYLRGMLTRAERKSSIAEAVAVAQRIIEKKGPFSEAARHASFYLADLHYLKKDFSTAARTYRRFIQAYGPKLNAAGDVADPPWKPDRIDDKTLQVYEAAVRTAHCWYMQGHTQNMVNAYRWLIENFPYRNPHAAEAHYWLALELLKGKEGRSQENRRKAAEELWKKVVHPSFDFEDRDFRKNFHPWVKEGETVKYAKAAILKSGELFSELGDHERAAGIFRQYLELYSPGKSGRRKRGEPPAKADEMYSIARYALGREYIKLGEIDKLLGCYRAYVDELRDDRFRASALRLLAFHASRSGAHEEAAEAYATLLDEYGTNEKDKQGQPIPVPRGERLRKSSYGWDGIRMRPPPGLDLGQVRYALGFHHWKREGWSDCVKTLAPFADDPKLFGSTSRPKALYMTGQSFERARDFARAAGPLLLIVRDHPSFDAIEEVYVAAARNCARIGKWSEIDRLNARFFKEHPRSANRPHMDLYAALSAVRQGKGDRGLKRLKSIADSDTYQDVKADACFFLAEHLMKGEPAKTSEALAYLNKSLSHYPRQRSCLAAAKCHVALRQWDQARGMLERAIRGFPAGDPGVTDEAKRLLSGVLKQLANSK